jgi:serine/threonine protein kinase
MCLKITFETLISALCSLCPFHLVSFVVTNMAAEGQPCLITEEQPCLTTDEQPHYTPDDQPCFSHEEQPCLTPEQGPSDVAPLSNFQIAANNLVGVDDLVLCRQLAQGGVGRVYVATPRGQPYIEFVVKMIPHYAVCDLGQEYALQRRCVCAYVPRVYRLFLPSDVDHYDRAMLMEYVHGVDMVDASHGYRITERVVRRIFQCIGAALLHCHTQGVIHQDVKPDNIVACRRVSGRYMLVDFGHAVMVDHVTKTGMRRVSTQEYMAPEAFDGPTITPAVDVWALGLTLTSLINGNDISGEMVRQNFQCMKTFVYQYTSGLVTPSLQHVLSRMLAKDPTQRPTFHTLQSEGWIGVSI